MFAGIFLSVKPSQAERGFTIEGGLIYDRPSGSSNKPFIGMESGLGYTANIGFDIFERGGLELGVLRTSHAYELDVVGGAVREDDAVKTTFYLKARGVPYKYEKFELVAGVGVGFFDIAGKRIIQENDVDENFSGFGVLTNLNFRYHVTGGLALSFYLGANFVNYDRYELFGFKTDYGRKLPGGDSINWGLTLFHRIGIPQI